MSSASSEGCEGNVTELHIIMLIKPGTYSIEQSFVKASNPVFSASFVCVQLKTKRRPFFTAAPIPTADAVEQCEPPCFKIPTVSQKPSQAIGSIFCSHRWCGAKGSVVIWVCGWLSSRLHIHNKNVHYQSKIWTHLLMHFLLFFIFTTF